VPLLTLFWVKLLLKYKSGETYFWVAGSAQILFTNAGFLIELNYLLESKIEWLW
jgi:hypothetical protein